jgi:Xaa-Pro aminopeptidase
VNEVVTIASTIFGIEKFWHKNIVRAGINTMAPFSANPPDVVIQPNDIVILDFGPIVDGWEADLARTYVVGNDPLKTKLKMDVENAWKEASAWFAQHDSLTGSAYFHYINSLARHYGYEYGNEIAGHIVGPFPHEQLGPGNLGLDIHPDNHQNMVLTDSNGNCRNWILEIHFVDRINGVGSLFEQLLVI